MHRRLAGGLVLGSVLTAAVCAGCSSSPSSGSAGSSTSTSASATAAPCTKSAITTAAKKSRKVGHVISVNGYGCAGSWAYADVTVGNGPGGFDAVMVLEAHGSEWAAANRATACTKHLVPSRIAARACSSS